MKRLAVSKVALLVLLTVFICLAIVSYIDHSAVLNQPQIPCTQENQIISDNGQMLGFGKSFSIHTGYFKHLLKNPPPVFTFYKEWKVNKRICENYFNFSNLNPKNFQLFNLNQDGKHLFIFTHNPSNDVISRQLASWGSEFEPETDRIIKKIMSLYPDAILVDIGANIGVKALQVLNSKRKVIGFEAIDTNIHHLCLSSAINQFNDNLTLIHNALSDSHKNVTFAVGANGDLSQNFVADSSNIKKLKNKANGKNYFSTLSKTTATVTLDDLLTFPRIKEFKLNGRQNVQCLIKMDVEGYEDAVLRGSRKFFRENDVIGMIMEWRWHKSRNDSASSILDFISENKMVIYDFRWNPLNMSQYSRWPHDIMVLSAKSVKLFSVA